MARSSSSPTALEGRNIEQPATDSDASERRWFQPGFNSTAGCKEGRDLWGGTQPNGDILLSANSLEVSGITKRI
jgi:hypothetical protein